MMPLIGRNVKNKFKIVVLVLIFLRSLLKNSVLNPFNYIFEVCSRKNIFAAKTHI